MKFSFAAFVAAALLAAPPVVRADSDHSKHGASAQAGAMTEGEVRKVDKDTKKVTIKHAPIANLDMPAMTMVFQVKDTAMLDQVKAGDKIKFSAEKIGGAYTVTRVEPVK